MPFSMNLRAYVAYSAPFGRGDYCVGKGLVL